MDISKIPKSSGCYLYKDSKNNIIYIGKAKNLYKRVASYFSKKNDLKTETMISNAKSVDFIVTDSEVEALILESNLIKKYKPKYNINLKDSKKYAYLQITEEKFPRLILARNLSSKGKFFGPFVSAQSRDYARDVLVKAFRLRTCRRLPKKECLRYHINLCSAPCIGNISKTMYNENISEVSTVLKGNSKSIISNLKTKMKESSLKQNFEIALDLRNKIDALENLKEKQNMQRDKKYDEDIINYIIKGDLIYLILFNVHRGILENKQSYVFDNSGEAIEEFILQYYSSNPIPKELILPNKIYQSLIDYLEKKRKKKFSVVVPKKGEKKHLLDLVSKNIELQFFSEEEALTDLMKKLKLNFRPEVIECFDVSHISGSSTVASMVQFRNGVPDKSNYRRFKIRTVLGIDDFSSIAEVVFRRYSRLKREGARMPDLIVIDGGKGQLSFAVNQLLSLNLRIPIISIAKKFEEVYVPGLSRPLKIDRKTKALRLLQRIRDEAHRFAINYNRLLRKKEILK